MIEKAVVWISDNLPYMCTIAAASALSYWRKVRSGAVKLSFLSFSFEMSMSIFCGWLLGKGVYMMGYTTTDHVIVASCVGAFMGDKLFSLITLYGCKTLGIERRNVK